MKTSDAIGLGIFIGGVIGMLFVGIIGNANARQDASTFLNNDKYRIDTIQTIRNNDTTFRYEFVKK